MKEREGRGVQSSGETMFRPRVVIIDYVGEKGERTKPRGATESDKVDR